MSKRNKKNVGNLHQNTVQINQQISSKSLPELDAMRDRFAVARHRRRLRDLLALATEDRRTYPHELQQVLYRDSYGRSAEVGRFPKVHVIKRPAAPGGTRIQIRDYDRFQSPQTTPVCRRREIRKRVLFALKKIGKGRSGRRRFIRPARWTGKSFIRCK